MKLTLLWTVSTGSRCVMAHVICARNGLAHMTGVTRHQITDKQDCPSGGTNAYQIPVFAKYAWAMRAPYHARAYCDQLASQAYWVHFALTKQDAANAI